MGPQYVNVCEVNHSCGSTYVTNWGFPEADQFVHRGALAALATVSDGELSLRFMSRLGQTKK